LEDVAFALNGLFATIVTVIGLFYLDKKHKGTPKLQSLPMTNFYFSLVLALWGLALVHAGLAFFGVIYWIDHPEKNGYNFLQYLGFCKPVIAFFKYIPQLYLNKKRKSTAGWSIANILLDFTGGMLSFLQQLLNYYISGNFEIIRTNAPKLLLGCVSIVFDILFMIQHFCLYRDKEAGSVIKIDENDYLSSPKDSSPQIKSLMKRESSEYLVLDEGTPPKTTNKNYLNERDTPKRNQIYGSMDDNQTMV